MKARAAMQGKVLVDAGWLETETAHAAELERLVPSLKDELAAVKKAKATVAATSHWTGTGGTILIPCDEIPVRYGPPSR